MVSRWIESPGRAVSVEPGEKPISTNEEIASRLNHYGDNIQRWRDEAASLTLRAAQARQIPPSEDELVALEKTANEMYDDIGTFQSTVDEVVVRSRAAASELQVVSDALRLGTSYKTKR